MLIVEIKFFLTDEGVKKFPYWYQDMYKAVSTKDGFTSLDYTLDTQKNIADLNLKFTSLEKQLLWVGSAEHKTLISGISKYFTQPPITLKKEVEEEKKFAPSTN